ncbi:hypothetical protein LOD99_12650 [Oopsacas minuta]|uniref:Peptidase M14 domain-containing protein n=1 Tax=Oopsacas minuta TaxID=111878 RepID=A0AAV7JCN5_9METZ|nr:hypothetical protein LOD99_12650 [Oopsacas minuta]
MYITLVLTSLLLLLPYTQSTISTGAYYSYSELTQLLTLLNNSEQCGNISQMFSVGKSVEGLDLWVMRLTHCANMDPNMDGFPGRPKFKYVGNMHGDETVGRQMLIYLIQLICEAHETDERIAWLIHSTDIYIMPSMNPDGFEKSTEGDCNRGHRANANGFDLNRNFPDQFSPNKILVIQPETQALMNWITSGHFVLSANLHGGAVVASYPFDDSPEHHQGGRLSPSPDDTTFKLLASSYATVHGIMSKPGPRCSYRDVFEGGITNGAYWYELEGGMQDYNYIVGNCMEITIELSCCKYPTRDHLPAYWKDNKESLITYIEQTQIGVKGFVTDEEGDRVEGACISVSGIAHNVYTYKYGDYWRLLAPGTYNISVHHEDYVSVESNVIVPEGPGIQVNFTLFPLSQNSPINETDTNLAVDKEPIQITENVPHDFSYHDYNSLKDYLAYYHNKCSNITSFYSIGNSVQNRLLYVIEFSDFPGEHEMGEPEFKYMANLRGDDAIGRELLLLLVKHLCEGYLVDPVVTELIHSTRIHILPSVNPDGFEKAFSEYKKMGDIIYDFGDAQNNVRGVNLMTDLNPDHKNMRQPETQAVLDWINSTPFSLSGILRGGNPFAVSYPLFWFAEDGYPDTDFNDAFKHLSSVYVDSMNSKGKVNTCDNSDKTSPRGWIINGYKWSPSIHTWPDYEYRYNQCFELTIDVSCHYFPSEKRIKGAWENHSQSLVSFISAAQKAISGVILDRDGRPIYNASVQIAGRSKLFSTTELGEFWILLPPGDYMLIVGHLYYHTKAANVTLSASGVMDFANMTLESRHVTQTSNARPILATLLALTIVLILVVYCTLCLLWLYYFFFVSLCSWRHPKIARVRREIKRMNKKKNTRKDGFHRITASSSDSDN